MDLELKFHKHVVATVSKARRLLGTISKCFINLSPQTFPYSYKSIVRPCLNDMAKSYVTGSAKAERNSAIQI